MAHLLLLIALAQAPPAPTPASAPPMLQEATRVALTAPPRLTRPEKPIRRPAPPTPVAPPKRARVDAPPRQTPAPRRVDIPDPAPRIEASPAVAIAPLRTPNVVPPIAALPTPSTTQRAPAFERARKAETIVEHASAEPQIGLFSAAPAKAAPKLQVEGGLTASAGFGSSTVGSIDGKPGPRPMATGVFGAVSTEVSSSGEPPTAVSPGGFAPAESRRAPAAPADKAVAKSSVLEPVRILAKPDPTYTEEARALRLEGDVVLEAVFTGDGRVEQIQVLRGLGHGLDEAAVDAVRAIDFEPARRAGVAEDARLRLTVRFQLAY